MTIVRLCLDSLPDRSQMTHTTVAILRRFKSMMSLLDDQIGEVVEELEGIEVGVGKAREILLRNISLGC